MLEGKRLTLKTKAQESLNAITDFIIGQMIWTVIFFKLIEQAAEYVHHMIELDSYEGGVIFTNFRLSEFLTLVSLSTTFFLFLHTRDLNLQLSEVR